MSKSQRLIDSYTNFQCCCFLNSDESFLDNVYLSPNESKKQLKNDKISLRKSRNNTLARQRSKEQSFLRPHSNRQSKPVQSVQPTVITKFSVPHQKPVKAAEHGFQSMIQPHHQPRIPMRTIVIHPFQPPLSSNNFHFKPSTVPEITQGPYAKNNEMIGYQQYQKTLQQTNDVEISNKMHVIEEQRYTIGRSSGFSMEIPPKERKYLLEQSMIIVDYFNPTEEKKRQIQMLRRMNENIDKSQSIRT